MAHDTHFLTRLERVRPGEVELALGLYRDPELVRALLDQSKTTEGAERVAIALGEETNGPWAVVARDGHFVTCLAADMRHELPVVSRGQVAAFTQKVQRLRELTEEAKRLTGIAEEEGRTSALLSRLYNARTPLSREAFRALASLEPALGPYFFSGYLTTCLGFLNSAATMARLDSAESPDERKVLDVYGRLLFAAGPLVVLGTMAGPRRVEVADPEMRSRLQAKPLLTSIAQAGVLSPFLHAVWAIGRLGKAVLPGMKRGYLQPVTRTQTWEGFCGLTVLGLRHSGLEAEVRKVLGRTQAGEKDPAPALERVFEVRDKFLELHRLDGAILAMKKAAHLPHTHRFAFKSHQDVPDEIAFPMLLQSMGDPAADDETFNLARSTLPFLARADPEELFLPQEFIDEVYRPWRPEDTLALLEKRRVKVSTFRGEGKRAPPNEPCPCGSGKKHKRCCMGKRTA